MPPCLPGFPPHTPTVSMMGGTPGDYAPARAAIQLVDIFMYISFCIFELIGYQFSGSQILRGQPLTPSKQQSFHSFIGICPGYCENSSHPHFLCKKQNCHFFVTDLLLYSSIAIRYSIDNQQEAIAVRHTCAILPSRLPPGCKAVSRRLRGSRPVPSNTFAG